MKQLSLTIEEVQTATGLGRTKIYEAISQGLLPAKKWGKRTVVLKADLENFLEKLSDYPVREEVKNG
ncbi:MAG: helix-turn-helix domain-containing protein [Alphaproteobacteria bacterium]|nr:helix-turn-helix domain-containing protein [Alphaproteobacteria bacterium]MDD9920538.1 helix-turn-helix domain-containing protein [Alphaproteobacteria bacterium]